MSGGERPGAGGPEGNSSPTGDGAEGDGRPRCSRRSHLRAVAAAVGAGVGTPFASGLSAGGGVPGPSAAVDARADATREKGDWPWFRGGGGLRGYAEWADVPDSRPDVRWVSESQWRVAAPVLVDGTLLWTGSRARLTRADARTGETQWSVDLTPGGAVSSARAPAVHDGTVYVPLSKGTSEETHELHARSMADGSERWMTTLNSDPAAVTVGGGRALVATHDSTLTAVDVADGSVAWTLPAQFTDPVPVGDGTAYVVRNGAGLVAVDAATGTERWRNDDFHPDNAPTVAGDELVVPGGNGLVALDREFGTVARERSLDGLPGNTRGVAVTDDALLVATRGGGLAAFERADFAERWRTTLDTQVNTPAVTDGDTVLWGTDDGRLLAFGVADGQHRWTREFGFDFRTDRTPALGNGAVFVAGDEILYALGRHETVPDPTTTASPTDATTSATETADGTATGTATRVPTTTDGAGADGSGLTVSTGVLLGGAAAALGLGSLGALAVTNRGGDETVGGADGADEAGSSGGSGGSSGSGGSNPTPTPAVAGRAASGGVDEEVRAHPAVADPVGEVVGGYELRGLIGSGGNANAYRAVDEAGVDAAVKLPRVAPDETVDRSVFRSFVREAEVWAELDDHEHVVDVLDWGERPVPWIATEYMTDGNLRRRVGEIRPKATVAVAVTIADALWYAHRNGVTHNDVKPENVLFGREDGRRTVKVADWGSANVRLEPDGPDGMTPAYAAPEQVEPDRFGKPDDMTDVYQLGVLVYELFTGHTPFERERADETLLAVVEESPPPPSARDDRIPGAVDDALLRALAAEKTERYDSVVHFRERLDTFLGDE